MFKYLVIVIEGCNQTPIIALYISMSKSSCSARADDTGGGVTAYVYKEMLMILTDRITG